MYALFEVVRSESSAEILLVDVLMECGLILACGILLGYIDDWAGLAFGISSHYL